VARPVRLTSKNYPRKIFQGTPGQSFPIKVLTKIQRASSLVLTSRVVHMAAMNSSLRCDVMIGRSGPFGPTANKEF
jgi:hypothetical protein